MMECCFSFRLCVMSVWIEREIVCSYVVMELVSYVQTRSRSAQSVENLLAKRSFYLTECAVKFVVYLKLLFFIFLKL